MVEITRAARGKIILPAKGMEGKQMKRLIGLTIAIGMLFGFGRSLAAEEGWKAGAASVVITPSLKSARKAAAIRTPSVKLCKPSPTRIIQPD